MDVKVSTKTKTVPAQNLLRYTSFLFAKTCICKTKKKMYRVERNSESYEKCHKIKERCILNIQKVSRDSKIGSHFF